MNHYHSDSGKNVIQLESKVIVMNEFCMLETANDNYEEIKI